jgi:hypothetical protein
MKKVLFVLALGAFAACGSGSDSAATTDSAASAATTTIDSTASAATTAIDSTAAAADSTVKAATDSLKK